MGWPFGPGFKLLFVSEQRRGEVFGASHSEFSKGHSRMLRKMAEQQDDKLVEHFVLHDLRRTATASMQRLGVPMPVTEAVLNHVSGSRGGIAGVYQRHVHFEE